MWISVHNIIAVARLGQFFVFFKIKCCVVMIFCDLVLFREGGVVFCSDERLCRDIDFHFFSPNKDTVRKMPADCSSYKHGEKSLFSPSSPWLHTASFFPHKSLLSSAH